MAQRSRAVPDRVHHVPVLTQTPLEYGSQRAVVLGDENPHDAFQLLCGMLSGYEVQVIVQCRDP
jgi:hypothetical protein